MTITYLIEESDLLGQHQRTLTDRMTITYRRGPDGGWRIDEGRWESAG